MTFYFGFTTDEQFFLCADRRRTWAEPKGKFEDKKTKLHKVNPWTYIVGAGFMHFVDEEIAKSAPEAFGSRPIDTDAFSKDMPKMQDQLRDLFADVARHAKASDPSELFSQFSVAGFSKAGSPFSCDWNSRDGWLGIPRVGRRHSFFLVRESPHENQELLGMVTALQGRAIEGDKPKHLAKQAQQILGWVAERDDGVSMVGDMTVIGPKGSRKMRLK